MAARIAIDRRPWAYRTNTRNLIVDDAAPEPIQVAELTADAFGTARLPPLLGRALVHSDELPGAPSVVVLGYEMWATLKAPGHITE